jgi:transcriptional regulator with XRE-family HTH domain
MKTLKTLRKEKGLTITVLSEIIGVHHKSIEGWEKGRTKPSLCYFPLLSETLGVTEEELKAIVERVAILRSIDQASKRIVNLRSKLKDLDCQLALYNGGNNGN